MGRGGEAIYKSTASPAQGSIKTVMTGVQPGGASRVTSFVEMKSLRQLFSGGFRVHGKEGTSHFQELGGITIKEKETTGYLLKGRGGEGRFPSRIWKGDQG